MYIKSVNIDEFGKFTDFSLDLSSGLNIIEGDNETGKSTVGMFIKFMFYGLNAAEREKYVGWGKNCCRGSLVLVCDGKEYKIERSLLLLAKGVKESVAIIDENLTPVFADKTPDKVFLGVSEKVFVSSAFVGAVSGTHIDGEKLTDAVENLLFSADETTNTAKALKKLDDERASLLHKNKKGGELYELENSIAECEVKLAEAQSANSEIFKLEDRINCDREKRMENADSASVIKAKLEEYNAYLAIAKLGKCEEQKKKADEAEAVHAEKRTELTVNEKLPNSEYIRRLRSLSSEMTSVQAELAESEKMLEGAESSLALRKESVSLLEQIERAGGEREIMSRLANVAKKKKKATVCSVMFAVFTVVALGVGIALAVGNKMMYASVGFGAAVVFAALCLVFAVSKKSALKNEQELTELFECENATELLQLIQDVKEEELIIVKKKNDIENAGERCQALRRKSEEKTKEALALTGAYKACEPDAGALSEEADRIEAELGTLAALKSESEKQNALYEQLRLETLTVNAERERAKIHGVLKTEELKTFSDDEQRRRLSFLEKSISSLDERILTNEKALAALTSKTQNPAMLSDALAEMKREYHAKKLRHGALELAHEKLQSASATLRGSICPKLSSEASIYMKIISGGKYGALGIDESYSITADGDGTTRSINAFSTGTADIAYISLRLALITTLYRQHTPFVMFDDSFAHMDGDRLKAMLTLLAVKGEDGMQSIVFSCAGRESDICTSHLKSNIIRMKKA